MIFFILATADDRISPSVARRQTRIKGFAAYVVVQSGQWLLSHLSGDSEAS